MGYREKKRVIARGAPVEQHVGPGVGSIAGKRGILGELGIEDKKKTRKGGS